MKKLSVLISLFLFSTTAVAMANQELLSQLPSELLCDASFMTGQSHVVIKNLNTETPVGNISGAPMVEYFADWSQVEIAFTDGCDAIYELVFSTGDLINLKSQKIRNVVGVAYYRNTDIPESDVIGTVVSSPSITVSCR
jgi:hypothetical protein